jgi:hypothetical protein
MIFVSWRVFADYATICMKTTPVTYATFWLIFLQQEPSILSIVRLFRDFCSLKRLRSISAMTFMIFSMVFVLAFPTLNSSMSGYAVSSEAFVADLDNSLIRFAEFDVVAYVIHDGWRINKTGQLLVPLGSYYSRDPNGRLGKITKVK